MRWTDSLRNLKILLSIRLLSTILDLLKLDLIAKVQLIIRWFMNKYSNFLKNDYF